MFQIDCLSHSQSKYRQFPQREPLRRNYHTYKVNPFSKRSLDAPQIKQETSFRIPLNLSKLYQKQSKNIIVRQSQSNQSRILREFTLMKPTQRHCSTETTKTTVRQKQITLDLDSSGSSDYHELRKNYLQKYCKPCLDQRLPRFQLSTQNNDTIDPWLVIE